MIAGIFRSSRKSALWVGMLLVAVLFLHTACDNNGDNDGGASVPG